jgi:hypothetical protein
MFCWHFILIVKILQTLGLVIFTFTTSPSSVRGLVKSTVLLDPITFLLFDPAIAYNFLHRPPKVKKQGKRA